MQALAMQIRLEPHQVAALDDARVMTDPANGLTITLSRQQVLLGILDQWIAGRQVPHQAAVGAPPGTEAPQKLSRKRTRQTAPHTLEGQPHV